MSAFPVLCYGARNVLPPLAAAGLAAWLVLLVATAEAGQPDSTTLALDAGLAAEAPQVLERSLRRQGLWVAWLAGFVPLVVARAAWAGALLGARDASWLAGAALGPLHAARIAGTLVAGAWLAGTGALLTAALAIEGSIALGTARHDPAAGAEVARDSPAASAPIERREPRSGAARLPRRIARLQHPAVVLDERTPQHTLALALPGELASQLPEPDPASQGRASTNPGTERAGTALALRLRALGPTRGTLAVTLARADATRTFERALDYHERWELPLPGPAAGSEPSTAPLVLSFDWNGEHGAYLLAANDLALFGAPLDERLASAEIAGRLALALSAWIALAFALAAWMRPACAAAAVGALQLAVWLAPAGTALPAAGLVDALHWLGLGRLVALPTPFAVGTTLAIGGSAVLAASVGLRRGRRPEGRA